MAFQSAVNYDLGFGVVGEQFLAGDVRATPANIVSGSAANNVIGRAFTISDDANSSGDAVTAAAGGTGIFGGILSNPKEYSTAGTAAGGALAPTLTLPNNSIGSLVNVTPGHVITLAGAADVGYWVEFVQATGVLNAIAAGGTVTSGSTIIKGARIERYDVASGLAVMSLNTVTAT